ncbi:hypothetical protein CHS0354_011430 [Potamilus streckersoni]|uniref:c-Myc-binding protein n=2 Tax=Unionidae TaxID=47526 RepID=A0AAE0SLW7_9BIVA|nr:hypothetical protein CHS0354_011430 [Potamilus streckersoni]
MLKSCNYNACSNLHTIETLNNPLKRKRQPYIVNCTKMTSYRAADSKREEFRKYLEKAGVLDALTKVLVGLYEEPEKPNNALDFLKQHLGAAGPETADVEALKLEVSELRQKMAVLQEQNDELRAKLQQHEPPAEEQAPES